MVSGISPQELRMSRQDVLKEKKQEGRRQEGRRQEGKIKEKKMRQEGKIKKKEKKTGRRNRKKMMQALEQTDRQTRRKEDRDRVE